MTRPRPDLKVTICGLFSEVNGWGRHAAGFAAALAQYLPVKLEDLGNVLFHIINDDDYEHMLQGINELLGKGGYLIFSENFLRGTTRHHENYWRSRSQNIIEEIVMRSGFEVISLDPLFVVMGSPVDTQAKWPAQVWDRVMKLAHTFHMGGLLGGLLYPLERVLLRQVRRGPSTKVMICRK